MRLRSIGSSRAAPDGRHSSALVVQTHPPSVSAADHRATDAHSTPVGTNMNTPHTRSLTPSPARECTAPRVESPATATATASITIATPASAPAQHHSQSRAISRDEFDSDSESHRESTAGRAVAVASVPAPAPAHAHAPAAAAVKPRVARSPALPIVPAARVAPNGQLLYKVVAVVNDKFYSVFEGRRTQYAMGAVMRGL